MAGSTTCRVCGQANDASSEFCVRCGDKLPDPSSTQLVSQPGNEAEYPWEPPAEWDPGELPPTEGQQQTWVGRNPDQVGWNTGQDTGAGTPPPAPWQPQPQLTQTGPVSSGPKSKKPLIFGIGGAVIVAAIIVVVVLVAGGGSKKKGTTGPTASPAALNGEQTKSATAVLDDTRVALRNAQSVHLAGTVQSNGRGIRLDLDLAGNDTQGTLTVNSNDVQIIKIDNDVYIKGDPDFLAQYANGDTQAVQALNGKWLLTTANGDFAQFSLDGFANVLKPDSTDKTGSTVTQSTLDGQPVVVLTQQDGSKLYVANTGEPYPLKLDGKGSSGGQVTFSDYNKDISIDAPASSDVVDLRASSPTPTPSSTPSVTKADLYGAYTCKSSGQTGTLTLNTDQRYTLSNNGTGGFWGSSNDHVAFSGGDLDKYAAIYSDGTLSVKGTGSNASVSFTCEQQ